MNRLHNEGLTNSQSVRQKYTRIYVNINPPSEEDQEKNNNLHLKPKDIGNGNRRKFLTSAIFASTTLLATQPSNAGEIGAKITKAVTQSDIGISVRKSVVRGAQTIDQLDGKWEKFSDTYNLGSERSRQDKRPKPKVIPDPLPLDSKVARSVIDTADLVSIFEI